mgnify:CR=1 FL=1
MNLDEFLTQGLIDSLNNGLIAPELITVYAGNYLAKSLITQDDMAKIQAAVTTYQAAQATKANSNSASGSTSTSESTPATTAASKTATN